MDYLIGWQKYETKFNGDPVSMELLSMDVSDVKFLTPYFETISNAGAGKDVFELQKTMFDLQEKSKPIVEKYCRNLTGITINGGAVITLDIITSKAVFNSLVQDILLKLLLISVLSGEDEKKSRPSSEKPEPGL